MDFTMGAAAEGPLKHAAESKTVRGEGYASSTASEVESDRSHPSV